MTASDTPQQPDAPAEGGEIAKLIAKIRAVALAEDLPYDGELGSAMHAQMEAGVDLDDFVAANGHELVIALESISSQVEQLRERLTDTQHRNGKNIVRADAAEAECAKLRPNAERWIAFCNLWAASTELRVRQDEEGTWSISQVESVENEVFSRLVGNDPDATIDAARKDFPHG